MGERAAPPLPGAGAASASTESQTSRDRSRRIGPDCGAVAQVQRRSQVNDRGEKRPRRSNVILGCGFMSSRIQMVM